MTIKNAERSVQEGMAAETVCPKDGEAKQGVSFSGVFAIDKPEGFTSFDVIAKLRGMLKIKRIGHAGTLDPMATGVLPIFVGRATKAVDLIPDQTKRYTATVQFGIKTDSGDITGEVIEQSERFCEEEALRRALSAFLGKSDQLPPMYSAVKIDGKRLYDIARSGGTAERKLRPIEIFDLKLLSYDESTKTVVLDVLCSKGTYIRTLAEDIAASVGCVATLAALCRTKSGPFDESDCITLDALQQLSQEERIEKLRPVDTVFSSFRRVDITEEEKRVFLNGVALDANDRAGEGETVRVYAKEEFLALAKRQDNRIKKTADFAAR